MGAGTNGQRDTKGNGTQQQWGKWVVQEHRNIETKKQRHNGTTQQRDNSATKTTKLLQGEKSLKEKAEMIAKAEIQGGRERAKYL